MNSIRIRREETHLQKKRHYFFSENIIHMHGYMHGYRMSQEFDVMNGLVKDNICHLPAAISKDSSKDNFHILDLTSPYHVLQLLPLAYLEKYYNHYILCYKHLKLLLYTSSFPYTIVVTYGS